MNTQDKVEWCDCCSLHAVTSSVIIIILPMSKIIFWHLHMWSVQGAFHVNSTQEICRILPKATPRLCNIKNGGLGEWSPPWNSSWLSLVSSTVLVTIAYILSRRRHLSYANHFSAQIGARAAMPCTYSLMTLRRHSNHFSESIPEISGVEYVECTLVVSRWRLKYKKCNKFKCQKNMYIFLTLGTKSKILQDTGTFISNIYCSLSTPTSNWLKTRLSRDNQYTQSFDTSDQMITLVHTFPLTRTNSPQKNQPYHIRQPLHC